MGGIAPRRNLSGSHLVPLPQMVSSSRVSQVRLLREMGESSSRREFLKACASIAAMLGLGPLGACSNGVPRSVRGSSVSTQRGGDAEWNEQVDWVAQNLPDSRPCVLWLNFSDCTGCTEAVLRANDPSFFDLVTERISLDYHETLMAPSGTAAETLLSTTTAGNIGEFFCVVEGSIPTAMGGNYGHVAGRTMLSIAQEICPNAKAILALGTCAAYGGIAAAAPNPTGAKGVSDALPELTVPVVNVPGCPPNPINILAVIVNYLLGGSLPPLDDLGRPLFAYERHVHDYCPFAKGPPSGDVLPADRIPAQARVPVLNTVGSGCQRAIGCKGTITHNNCPSLKFNEGTSFPMQAGHPCIGCSEPQFWDRMTPFYQAI